MSNKNIFNNMDSKKLKKLDKLKHVYAYIKDKKYMTSSMKLI